MVGISSENCDWGKKYKKKNGKYRIELSNKNRVKRLKTVFFRVIESRK